MKNMLIDTLLWPDYQKFWNGRPKCEPLCSDARAIPNYKLSHPKGELTGLLKVCFKADYFHQTMKRDWRRLEQQFDGLDDSVGKPK